MKRTLTLPCLLVVLAATPATLPAAHAAQSFDACTHVIATLPAVLDAPGIWCVVADMAMAAPTGNAIQVAADNVILDCNDFLLDGSGAGAGTAARGIYAANQANVTVRRCGVRGFYRGISLSGGSGHVVEGNRIDGSTFQGINVNADRSIVRDNRVSATGGSTASAGAFGIVAYKSVDVIDNRVVGVTPRNAGNGTGYGIFVSGNPTGSIDQNLVGGVGRDGVGTANGIWLDASTRVSLVGNAVTGDGSSNSTGVHCTSAQNRLRGNTIAGFVAGMPACGDAGGNDVSP